jgi:hypothetical protein
VNPARRVSIFGVSSFFHRKNELTPKALTPKALTPKALDTEGTDTEGNPRVRAIETEADRGFSLG